MAKTYEYLEVDIPANAPGEMNPEVVAALNQLGASGWQLRERFRAHTKDAKSGRSIMAWRCLLEREIEPSKVKDKETRSATATATKELAPATGATPK